MRRRITLLAGSAWLTLVLGCFSDYPSGGLERMKQGTGTSGAGSSGSKADQLSPNASPAPPTVPPGQTSGSMTPGYPPPTASPARTAPAQGATISLSAGVALPQATLDGTMMGFSVDYLFIQGQPHPSESFSWVIERSRGTPARIAIRLESKGNLAVPLLPWRPEQGPFRTHIEDSSGRRVSETADLRAP